MDDAESCRRLQCLRHPQRNHQRPFPVDHITAVDHLLNRPTVDVFHHQHAHARRLVDSGIDHRDDSRMTDPAGNSAFPKKFLHKVRSRLHDRRQQHLDRHLAARNFGNGKINLPHAAAAEKSFNPVLSETVSCLKHRIRRKIHLIFHPVFAPGVPQAGQTFQFLCELLLFHFQTLIFRREAEHRRFDRRRRGNMHQNSNSGGEYQQNRQRCDRQNENPPTGSTAPLCSAMIDPASSLRKRNGPGIFRNHPLRCQIEFPHFRSSQSWKQHFEFGFQFRGALESGH